jgi:hypothetical protein
MKCSNLYLSKISSCNIFDRSQSKFNKLVWQTLITVSRKPKMVPGGHVAMTKRELNNADAVEACELPITASGWSGRRRSWWHPCCNWKQINNGYISWISDWYAVIQMLKLNRCPSLALGAGSCDTEMPHQPSLLMLKHVVKHEHTLVWFTIQELALLAVRTGLTGRDDRFDRYDKDHRDGQLGLWVNQ